MDKERYKIVMRALFSANKLAGECKNSISALRWYSYAEGMAYALYVLGETKDMSKLLDMQDEINDKIREVQNAI